MKKPHSEGLFYYSLHFVPDPVPASAPPIVHRSRKESWRMWTLENGLEDLPRALHKKLCVRGVDVRMGTRCEGISMTAKGIQVGRFSSLVCRLVQSSVCCSHGLIVLILMVEWILCRLFPCLLKGLMVSKGRMHLVNMAFISRIKIPSCIQSLLPTISDIPGTSCKHACLCVHDCIGLFVLQVGIDGEVIEADHVISALPAQRRMLCPFCSYSVILSNVPNLHRRIK